MMSKFVNKKLEQASTALSLIAHFVEPNSAGTTNTVCQAELTTTAAAIMHCYTHNEHWDCPASAP
eukprot:scaffold21142_cov21-Tisochrysis_lutea.AAC.1